VTAHLILLVVFPLIPLLSGAGLYFRGRGGGLQFSGEGISLLPLKEVKDPRDNEPTIYCPDCGVTPLEPPDDLVSKEWSCYKCGWRGDPHQAPERRRDHTMSIADEPHVNSLSCQLGIDPAILRAYYARYGYFPPTLLELQRFMAGHVRG